MAIRAGDVDAHVGQRMRQRREALGVSQGRLARHLGLSFSQVQKYEKGTNRIGAGRLFLLAGFLEVPVQYFFEGLEDGPPKRTESGWSSLHGAELAVLDDAFLSISDLETRQSLVALVRSLATSAESVARPRAWRRPIHGAPV